MNTLLEAVDLVLKRASAAFRQSLILQRFTLLTRILMAMAFFPTGLVKALGRPFTLAGTETTVGNFFDAMHSAGPWWQFIGLAQIVPCIFLLIPRTSTLGAVLFFPVMLNILIITLSMRFGATSVVTSFMFLATLFLLIWDYDRLRLAFAGILGRPTSDAFIDLRRPVLSQTTRLEISAFWVLAICGLTLFSALRSLVPFQAAWASLLVGTIGCIMLAVSWIQCAFRRFQR